METKPSSRSKRGREELEVVAGNGLLDRRAFLRGGAALAAAMTGYTLARPAAAAPLADDPWSRAPGTNVPAYGVPSRFEKSVVRTHSNPNGEPRTQHGRTPHHLLHGTSTPNGLHFVISHAGEADIDPEKQRLLLPGWEGNMNVKWLRRLKLVEAPAMSYYESRTYAPILPSGKAYQFYFLQEVKSFITHPSPGLMLRAPGFYEISGIAYSGNGRISKVMVSADGGQSWAQAALHEPVLSKAFTRFRVPWSWNGGPAVLQSRAWDEAGNVQPTRAQIIAVRGQTAKVPPVTAFPSQHYNGVTSWAISSAGAVSHVYA